MAANDVYKKLLMTSDSNAEYAISAGFDDYTKRIYDIACDIYDSCIKDYYSSYYPTSYKRHGDIYGFNLYRANDLYYSPDNFIVSFDSDNLLPYPGKKGSYVRKRVLDHVMSGLRGTGMRSWQTEWPMPWYTRYPNEYSEYYDWHSVESTMDDIFRDFVSNVVDDTKYLLHEFIAEYI